MNICLWSHNKCLNPWKLLELEGIILSEISQTDKDKYHMISIPCGIKTNRRTHTNITQRYGEHAGGCWGGGGVDGEEGEMKWVRWPKGTKVQLLVSPGCHVQHGEYSYNYINTIVYSGVHLSLRE